MKVVVKSVYDAFEYVMQHYYPAGMKDMVEKSDTYAVISIQDSHTDGFGITFSRNQYCRAVLTLQFDDIIRPVDGAQLFNEDMADEIIHFIRCNYDVETLLIHCYAGQSRSQAVGAFAVWLLGGDNSEFFKNYNLNEYVYSKLVEVASKVHEDSVQETDEEPEMSVLEEEILFNPVDLTVQEIEKLNYTGTEYKDANKHISEFCKLVPHEINALEYLYTAADLVHLYGDMNLIMDEPYPTEDSKKKIAVIARKIDLIVAEYCSCSDKREE